MYTSLLNGGSINTARRYRSRFRRYDGMYWNGVSRWLLGFPRASLLLHANYGSNQPPSVLFLVGLLHFAHSAFFLGPRHSVWEWFLLPKVLFPTLNPCLQLFLLGVERVVEQITDDEIIVVFSINVDFVAKGRNHNMDLCDGNEEKTERRQD